MDNRSKEVAVPVKSLLVRPPLQCFGKVCSLIISYFKKDNKKLERLQLSSDIPRDLGTNEV